MTRFKEGSVRSAQMGLACWLKRCQRLLANQKNDSALNAGRIIPWLPLMRLSMFGVAGFISKLAPR